MQLYILDKEPSKSANLVPNKYKFKMLLELGQMISTLTNNGVYKPIKQGKELVCWIGKHKSWTRIYFETLLRWSENNINMKYETREKLLKIYESLTEDGHTEPEVAYFRYKEGYPSNIPSKSLLDIDRCIINYQNYLDWKLK